MNDNYNDSPSFGASQLPAANNTPPKKDGWERDLLEKLAFASLNEQRARRRWGIFFKLSFLLLIVFGILMAVGLSGKEIETSTSHTALIEIDGVIDAAGNGSAEVVNRALDRAFSDDSAVGVILRINSPGGSPVQAGMINDEIKRLRKAHPKKLLHVVVEEMCASGGYYVAAAADKIYVNKASIVGSIGVLMDGYGFTGLMDKIGVERRLMTAGENKGFLDPFSPQSPKHKEYAQVMLNEIHQQFIDVVRAGRGKRLKETPDTFSGLFWTGSKAVEMGLADGFGTVNSVARNEFKSDEIVDYTEHEGLSDRVLKKFGAAAGTSAVKAILNGLKPVLR